MINLHDVVNFQSSDNDMMVRESQIRCAHIICKLPANIYRHSRRAVRNPEPLARLRRPFEKFGGVVATSEFKMMLKTQLVLAPRPFKLPAHHHSILSGLIRNPEPLAGLRQLPTRQVSKSDRLRLRRIDAEPSVRLRVRPEHCDGRASVCGASGQVDGECITLTDQSGERALQFEVAGVLVE